MSDTLGIVLFIIVSFSWTIYIVQEMFITGSSALNMSVAKDEGERKQIQIASGLHFDGIEVWLVGALTITLGAFPLVFATTLTHLYIPFFLLIYAIIGRGVSIEVIYKLESKKWIKSMVITWMVSSIAIMFILGVYLTNVFHGFPLGQDGMTEGFLSIVNVTGISGGLLFVALSLVSGAAWISLTTSGDVGKKAVQFVKKVGVIYSIPVFLLLVFMGFNNTVSSIFIGELFMASYAYFILPALTVMFATMTTYYAYKENAKKIFMFSIHTMAFFLITGFVGMYPFMVPSYINSGYGITLFDAMAAASSLKIIAIAVAIFFPLIFTYQTWKYLRFTKKVNYNDE